MIAVIDTCWRMFSRLPIEAKLGLAMLKKPTSTIRVMKGAMLRSWSRRKSLKRKARVGLASAFCISI